MPWKVEDRLSALILTQGHCIANPEVPFALFFLTFSGNMSYKSQSKFLNFSLIAVI